jgi:protein SCO1/2
MSRLLAALALAMIVAGPAFGKDKPAFPVKFGGAFELVDHSGQIRRDRDFHGRFLLITFGYTHCPDICPTTLQSIAETLESLGPLARHLNAAFVSVDPHRDRPAALADYVNAFHPQLIGLTGSEAQIASVAKRYKLHRRKVVTADSTDDGDYLVDHGSLTFLMGPDGAFVTLFPFNTPPERMVSTVRKYLRKINL